MKIYAFLVQLIAYTFQIILISNCVVYDQKFPILSPTYTCKKGPVIGRNKLGQSTLHSSCILTPEPKARVENTSYMGWPILLPQNVYLFFAIPQPKVPLSSEGQVFNTSHCTMYYFLYALPVLLIIFYIFIGTSKKKPKIIQNVKIG